MSGIPLPWFRSRRCTRFISPDLAPVQGSLVTALPINILPLRVPFWLAGHSRGLGVGRSRSRSDRLGDCPDETDELTSHRRNGDVLELAPPEQRSVTLIEAGLRLPGNLANRLRHRLDLDLFVFAQPRRKLITPGTLDQHASHPPIAGLGDRTTLDLVTGGVLGRHDPDIGHQLTGCPKPREVADFATMSRPRIAISAITSLQSDQSGIAARIAASSRSSRPCAWRIASISSSNTIRSSVNSNFWLINQLMCILPQVFLSLKVH